MQVESVIRFHQIRVVLMMAVGLDGCYDLAGSDSIIELRGPEGSTGLIGRATEQVVVNLDHKKRVGARCGDGRGELRSIACAIRRSGRHDLRAGNLERN